MGKKGAKFTVGCHVMDKKVHSVMGTVLDIDSDGDLEIKFTTGEKKTVEKKYYKNLNISEEEFLQLIEENATRVSWCKDGKHHMQVFTIPAGDPIPSRTCSKCQESLPDGTKMSACRNGGCGYSIRNKELGTCPVSYRVCKSCASTSEFDEGTEFADYGDGQAHRRHYDYSSLVRPAATDKQPEHGASAKAADEEEKPS